MARIADEEVERLKKEVALDALVTASGVELRKAGADLVGRRPFHDDREPSLVVSPGKNLWHCLGACNAGAAVDIQAQWSTTGSHPRLKVLIKVLNTISRDP